MSEGSVMYLAGVAVGTLVGAWFGWPAFLLWPVALLVLWLTDRRESSDDR